MTTSILLKLVQGELDAINFVAERLKAASRMACIRHVMLEAARSLGMRESDFDEIERQRLKHRPRQKKRTPVVRDNKLVKRSRKHVRKR